MMIIINKLNVPFRRVEAKAGWYLARISRYMDLKEEEMTNPLRGEDSIS
jgi:hypothetical protein